MKKVLVSILALLAVPVLSFHFFTVGAAPLIFDYTADISPLADNYADFLKPVTILSPNPDQVLKNMPRKAGIGWEGQGDATDYEIELQCKWCDAKSSDTPWQASVMTKIHYYTHWITPAIAHDGEYRFRIRGVAKNGWLGPWSQYRYFSYDTHLVVELPQPAQTKVLAVPEISSPAAESVLTHYPRLTDITWNAINGAAAYNVELECDVCVSATQKWKGGVLYRTATPTLHLDNMAGANQFRARVRAVDAGGAVGSWSNYRYFSYSQ